MEELLRKFALLAIKVGVNLQKDQFLLVNGDVKDAKFIEMIVEAAYQEGARQVFVNYSDEQIQKLEYQYQSKETLTTIPDWMVAQRKYFIEQGHAVISVHSPNPEVFQSVDISLMQAKQKAANQALGFYRQYTSNSQGQWLGFCLPSVEWAKVVYPALPEEEALEKLYQVVFDICHISKDSDPVEYWQNHVANIMAHRQVLTDYAFDRLVFTNGLGTSLEVGLVDHHAWAGGQEITPDGIGFTPNLPTEEIFCMPHRNRVNGKVVATKPLNVLGKLVEDFYFVFKDGKVVEYDAKKNKEALTSLLASDEGATHLGEVALIADSSPISKTNMIFYNTAYDENASCHLALGNCYGSNLAGSQDMTQEQMQEAGANFSSVHCDFMFGSSDLKVVGYTKNDEAVTIMEQGEFVI